MLSYVGYDILALASLWVAAWPLTTLRGNIWLFSYAICQLETSGVFFNVSPENSGLLQ